MADNRLLRPIRARPNFVAGGSTRDKIARIPNSSQLTFLEQKKGRKCARDELYLLVTNKFLARSCIS
jgi:hypothetical protein